MSAFVAKVWGALYVEWLFRYLLIAGAGWVLFYLWMHLRMARHKIQPEAPERARILAEVLYSLSTFAVFASAGIGVLALQRAGIAQLYPDIRQRGVPYFAASVGLMILLHDAYFYWTHRLMHAPTLFPLFHRVHHLSTNPTPWAAFSFHPLEAVVEAGIVPLIVLVMPSHPAAILVFLTYMTAMNVLGHLGYELFPRGATRHPLLRWSNTSTHHNLHHRSPGCNFGLYFNHWDRWMGTNHPEYHARFEAVKDRAEAGRDLPV